ncbi:MAG: hypothetical protein ACOYN0_08690 [Phycisphaerales bacterium]
MRRFTLAAVVGAALVCSPVMAQSTTYQGRLDLGGAPANGEYDFQFVVYPSMVGGAALDTTSIGGLPVSNGLFTASISVQTAMSQVATGWLELRVRRSGDPFFLALSPRQELTPAPRAASLRLPFIQSGESATDSGSIVNLTNSRATGGGALTGFGRLWGLIGVAGNITSYPLLPAVTGVVGISSSGTGVAGVSSGGDGVYGRSSSGAGGFFEAILLDTGTALRVETSAANASAAEFARLETSATGPAVRITSASTAAGASALTSEMTSVAPGGFSAAVRAINAGTGGSGIGVWASQAGSPPTLVPAQAAEQAQALR